MKLAFSCPSCGAEVRFQSSVSAFVVCAYCHSMLVRQDLDLKNIGIMAQLKEDASPLQIGTTGDYKGDRFSLIGRVKQVWEDGFWNEWFTLFESGKIGWIAEAQGFYMVSFESANGMKLPGAQEASPGARFLLGEDEFEVDDVKDVICEGSEGELPTTCRPGQKMTSVDLVGPRKSFANICYEDQGARLFLGEYIGFDNLSFKSLKALDGW